MSSTASGWLQPSIQTEELTHRKPITTIDGAVRTIDDWAHEAMTVTDWAGAVTVYDRGLKYLPENGHLKNNRQYCVGKRDEAESRDK